MMENMLSSLCAACEPLLMSTMLGQRIRDKPTGGSDYVVHYHR